MSSLSMEFKEFMKNIVKETMEFRESNNVNRKDFIQLLMELRKTTTKMSNDNDLDDDFNESLTLEQCTAQVALFYLAGFDTTASAISYCLFELSRQPQLMKRVQCEIDEIMKKHNNNITFENINEMPLLDACVRGKYSLEFFLDSIFDFLFFSPIFRRHVSESVRMYPTLPFLNRICTKEYTIPNTKLTIKKGTPIVISLLGIMRDPNNFPEPEKFLPDRYDEEKPNYKPSAFLAFGDGPRNCIGEWFLFFFFFIS